MKKIKGYIFSRPFFKERAPQHIQNIIIRDFCKNNNLHYSLSAVEFTMEESFKTLNEIINNMKNLDGIVAYSLFQLPVNDEVRQKIVNKIINKNKIIYFALEDLIEYALDEDQKKEAQKLIEEEPAAGGGPF